MQNRLPHCKIAFNVAVVILGVGLGSANAASSNSSPSDRQMLDHFLRRFAFSAPPETVDAMLDANPKWLAAANAWIDQQTGGLADVNSDMVPMQPLPAPALIQGCNQTPCLSHFTDDRDYEYGYIEHSIGTNLQLQAKLELHWIDHFSVAGAVSPYTEMLTYDAAVRANALGNFQTLLTAVAEQPAELYALSNNFNVGSNPNSLPNVNFAREIMQLFSFGPFQLNMDGTTVAGANGQPVPAYSDPDIYTLAYAMTGYRTSVQANATHPLTMVYTTYNPLLHYRGAPATFRGHPLNRFLGQPFAIPAGADPIAHVVKLLAHNPSTAPFQAKELLQRFAIENPPPAYVERIAKVWAAHVDAPDQIAEVVRAIVNDPLFPSSYQSMTKQPEEKVFGFLRQLPGMFAPVTALSGAPTTERGAATVRGILQNLGQDAMYPPDVFSFYTPGDVEALSTEATYITWLAGVKNLVCCSTNSAYGVWIDIPTLRARIAARNNIDTSQNPLTPLMIATYLLGAMIDAAPADVEAAYLSASTGTDPIHKVIAELQATNDATSDSQIESAIWLIAASPQYNVN